MNAEHVIVEADGGSRGNPGPAGYGAVVFDATSRAVLAERAESIGTATNNVAEYGGLIAGLRAAQELGARRVDVRMDSKLVVEQMSGRWSVKNAALQGLSREAQALRRGFDHVSFTWIPREKNKHADRLANEAMDGAAGIAPKPARAAKTPPAPAWTPPSGARTGLLLVRHGATVHSAEHRLSGRNDLPLDAVGRAQAASLAGRAWGDVGAVVSSPLPRAVETATAIAGALGLEIEIEDDLVELDFGSWEGLTMAEVRERDADAFAAWTASPDAAPPGGESMAAVARRVRRARETVIGRHPEQRVVVVSHVTPIKTLLRLALDAPPTAMYRLHLDTASVSAVDYWADGTSSVRLVNDTGHL
ncbi:bifunctional RNase H/acid phosphatase [Jatrophihabitans fulvus]